MARPVILAVDDDREVLQAVQRDLRSYYAADYCVMGAESGQTVLGLSRELLLRGEPVALFVVDQRMPGMTVLRPTVPRGLQKSAIFQVSSPRAVTWSTCSRRCFFSVSASW